MAFIHLACRWAGRIGEVITQLQASRHLLDALLAAAGQQCDDPG
jgi:hypothetical protein